ncbi:Oligosaccharide translocation protein rft1 [Exophiala dermatitidis]|uniref:Man(5)GlcNAc(2)-PP-dolichol translocation protein RFT1 n=1 Tax=Exophiala dermatitidis (strain ATCC 34100 / CBS 525.76 / NIH/UT8656) TaxID=858893 RepID=H6C3N3_EXODN|nr:oligosaccharidyl-lipid flippase [Exophiala dermatitidis NIH/UT8656]KAJ4519631.1 Oligosaccharide translocation protein rft1 [Exophiala dermatitidis]EHY58248.1 oligosaccharidyl-lipid flippase [Exophiala dermatitidis NIH/UT8656]KAJ4551084.1 Oligosaccharide translocation protein rft1 [Exophiala dermatitidis]KAJ4596343.1 Oligosaccharide translocation protein rft1 [Exophiala dermatitidis]KAJ4619756.1 Oligosaccharide translocation protein rft1 [Exophiala dermatitidis]
METDQSALSGSGAVLLILIQVASRALTFIGNQFLLRFLSPSLLGIAVQLELVSVTSLYFARESLRVALQRTGSLTTVPVLPPGGGVVDTSDSSKSSSTSGSTKDSTATHAKEAQTVINLSYLAVLLGFGISTFFGISYLQSAPTEVTRSPYFDISFQIYAVATLVELLAEPAFVVIQQKALFKERARAETSAAVARCLAACLAAVLGHRRGLDPSILPFAVGQAAYAVVLLVLYFVPVVQISKRDKFSLIPRRLETEAKAQELGSSSSQQEYYINLFHVDTLGLAATMYMQSIFKLVLTQGDALILSFLSTLADQGAFALASNYGGLLARLVFQPVEESSRNIFGQLLSSPTSASSSSSAAAGEAPSSANRDGRNQTGSAEEKGTGTGEKDTDTGTTTKTKPKTTTQRTSKIPIPIPIPIPNQHRQALSYLATTLHFYFLMALPLLAIAPYILPMLVRQVIGADWYTDSTASLLSAYCYYIPLMAVNGILDAFVTSVATPAQLRAQSGWMMLFTALYGAAAWLLLKKFEMGAAGLVGANMVNMVLRIVWSRWFIRRWIRNDVEANSDTGRGGSDRGTAAAAATLLQKEILAEALPAKTCLVVAALVGLELSMATTTAPSTGTYTGTGLDRQLLGLVVAATVLLGSTM